MSGSERAQIVEALREKAYRDEYVAANIETGIAFQIRANRASRELTQAELGEKAGMKQAAISRLEGHEHGRPNLDTLLRLASAFDVALIVRFVPFSELVSWTTGLGDADLSVVPFDKDAGLIASSATSASPPQIKKRGTSSRRTYFGHFHHGASTSTPTVFSKVRVSR